MKYKLINKTTGEEHICDKMVVDGWDYYVSDEGVVNPCYFYNKPTNYLGKALRKEGNFWVCENIEGFHLLSEAKKVIATNNPNIDIPKVVDEVEILAEKFIGCKYEDIEDSIDQIGYDSFKRGYNKSQETHPFSEEDMIEFAEWKNEKYKLLHGEYVDANDYYLIPDLKSVKKYTTKELLQLWKEQRPKTLYYE